VREHEPPQHWDHKRIGAALSKELPDPALEPTSKDELRPEHFILSEDQKERPDRDPERSNGPVIPAGRGASQRGGGEGLFDELLPGLDDK
jgi:hypothetical protein